MIKTKSNNRAIFSGMMRKSRRGNLPSNVNYLFLYGFLYKFMSDRLKNFMLKKTGETDIRRVYSNLERIYELRKMCLDEMGYFIESDFAFMDQYIDNNIIEALAGPEFYKILKDHITFSDGNQSEKYFNRIFEILQKQYGSFSLTRDDELNLFVSNFMYTISKLNIDENSFTFRQVYDAFASSRQIHIPNTPEYISNIITSIVESQLPSASSVYDPFMGDSSILFNLAENMHVGNIVGKESRGIGYFYSVIKAFIHEVNLNRIFFFNEDAISSMSVRDRTFDVIVSKIPTRFPAISKRRKQSLEAPSPKNVSNERLLSNVDMDRISDDKEAMEALEFLQNRIVELKKREMIHFSGEYESLKDSEFLFLINMINSLDGDGVMVVSLSQNFLFKNSLTLLRKFLTYENNYIDAIISLPEELGRSVRPEVIIVFRKNKRSGDIVFIDLSKKYGTVPSRNATGGLLRRNLILDNATTSKIIDVLNNRKTIEKFSNVVRLDELKGTDFNLTVSRYVDTYEGEFIRLADLKMSKTDIEYGMAKLNDKIDNLLHELDMYF